MQKHLMVAFAAALSVSGLTTRVSYANHEVVQPGEPAQSTSHQYQGDEAYRWSSSSAIGPAFMAPRAYRTSGSFLDLVIPPIATPLPALMDAPGGDPPPRFALPVITSPSSPRSAPLPDSNVSTVLAQSDPIQSGLATWYGPGFNGEQTYCGDVYDQTAYTAASNTLSCETVVIVTNPQSGLQVRVRINDRGGFGGNVILDLSGAAFHAIAPASSGVIPVSVALPVP